MDKVKRLIILLSVIIVIILIIFVIIRIKINYTGSDYQEIESEKEITYEAENKLGREKNRNKYYAIREIYNSFLDANLNQNKDYIYSMLDESYIEALNLSKENVCDKIKIFNIDNLSEYQANMTQIEFVVEDVYRIEKSINISIYFVYGSIVDKVKNEKNQYNLMIEMDSKNQTFYILPQEYMEKNNYMDNTKIEECNISIEEIKEKEYNTFEFKNIDDITIINDYLSKYQNLVIEDIEKSYDLLDEEYKKLKFNSYLDYKNYVEENMRDILSKSIVKYKIKEKTDSNEYICMDQKDNFFIFKESSIMDYKIMLDTYTINTDEFIEKYENENSKTKVGRNVDKIIRALKDRDYNYIYRKLDETFRNNNFDTIEKFSEYMRKNYSDNYKVNYYEVSEKLGVYEQTIDLIPEEDKDEKIKMTIIMQLKEGTDFVMSFNIQE